MENNKEFTAMKAQYQEAEQLEKKAHKFWYKYQTTKDIEDWKEYMSLIGQYHKILKSLKKALQIKSSHYPLIISNLLK